MSTRANVRSEELLEGNKREGERETERIERARICYRPRTWGSAGNGAGRGGGGDERLEAFRLSLSLSLSFSS